MSGTSGHVFFGDSFCPFGALGAGGLAAEVGASHAGVGLAAHPGPQVWLWALGAVGSGKKTRPFWRSKEVDTRVLEDCALEGLPASLVGTAAARRYCCNLR